MKMPQWGALRDISLLERKPARLSAEQSDERTCLQALTEGCGPGTPAYTVQAVRQGGVTTLAAFCQNLLVGFRQDNGSSSLIPRDRHTADQNRTSRFSTAHQHVATDRGDILEHLA